MGRDSKYIEIQSAGVSASGKTRIWSVRNKRTNETCGLVKWYGGFRKYCFFPTDGFLFDANCLAQIISHLDTVNATKSAKHRL